MRVLETGEKKGGAGGLFGRAGRNIHRDGRGEEDNAVGIGATQGSGEGDEGRASQRQRTGEQELSSRTRRLFITSTPRPRVCAVSFDCFPPVLW
jgi:hypothetical protein